MNDVDQFLGAFGARASFVIRIDDVHPNMILDDFSHQAVHRAAGGDDEMEDVRASFFAFDCALEGLDLTEDAAHPVEELGFFFDGVSHAIYLIPKGVWYLQATSPLTPLPSGEGKRRFEQERNLESRAG